MASSSLDSDGKEDGTFQILLQAPLYFQSFQQYRADGLFTDLCISCDEKIYRVHATIMSAACPFVCRLLKRNTSKSTGSSFKNHPMCTKNVSLMDVLMIETVRKTTWNRNDPSLLNPKASDSSSFLEGPSLITLALEAGKNGKPTLVVEGIERSVMDLCLQFIYCESFRIKKSQIPYFIVVARSLKILGSERFCQELEMRLVQCPERFQQFPVLGTSNSGNGDHHNEPNLQKCEIVANHHPLVIPKKRPFQVTKFMMSHADSRSRDGVNKMAVNYKSQCEMPLNIQSLPFMPKAMMVDKQFETCNKSLMPLENTNLNSLHDKTFNCDKSPQTVMCVPKICVNRKEAQADSVTTHNSDIYGSSSNRQICSITPCRIFVGDVASKLMFGSKKGKLVCNTPFDITSAKDSLDSINDSLVKAVSSENLADKKFNFSQKFPLTNTACGSQTVQLHCNSSRSKNARESSEMDALDKYCVQKVCSDNVQTIDVFTKQHNHFRITHYNKTCKIAGGKSKTKLKFQNVPLKDHRLKKSKNLKSNNKVFNVDTCNSGKKDSLCRDVKDNLYSTPVYVLPKPNLPLKKRRFMMASNLGEYFLSDQVKVMEDGRNYLSLNHFMNSRIHNPNSIGKVSYSPYVNREPDVDISAFRFGCRKDTEANDVNERQTGNQWITPNVNSNKSMLGYQTTDRWLTSINEGEVASPQNTVQSVMNTGFSDSQEGLMIKSLEHDQGLWSSPENDQEQSVVMGGTEESQMSASFDEVVGRNDCGQNVSSISENARWVHNASNTDTGITGHFSKERNKGRIFIGSNRKICRNIVYDFEENSLVDNVEGSGNWVNNQKNDSGIVELSLKSKKMDYSMKYNGMSEIPGARDEFMWSNCIHQENVFFGDFSSSDIEIDRLQETRCELSHNNDQSSMRPCDVSSVEELTNSMITENRNREDSIREAACNGSTYFMENNQSMSSIVEHTSDIKVEEFDEHLACSEDFSSPHNEWRTENVNGEHLVLDKCHEHMIEKNQLFENGKHSFEEYEFVSILGSGQTDYMRDDLPTFKEELPLVFEECENDGSNNWVQVRKVLVRHDDSDLTSNDWDLILQKENNIENQEACSAVENTAIPFSSPYFYAGKKAYGDPKNPSVIEKGKHLNISTRTVVERSLGTSSHKNRCYMDIASRDLNIVKSRNTINGESVPGNVTCTEMESDFNELTSSAKNKELQDESRKFDFVCSDTDSSEEAEGADIYTYVSEQQLSLWTPQSSPEIQLSPRFFEGNASHVNDDCNRESSYSESRKEREISSYRKKILESASSFHSKQVGKYSRRFRTTTIRRRFVKARQKRRSWKTKIKESVCKTKKPQNEASNMPPNMNQTPLQDSIFQVIDRSDNSVQDLGDLSSQKTSLKPKDITTENNESPTTEFKQGKGTSLQENDALLAERDSFSSCERHSVDSQSVIIRDETDTENLAANSHWQSHAKDIEKVWHSCEGYSADSHSVIIRDETDNEYHATYASGQSHANDIEEVGYVDAEVLDKAEKAKSHREQDSENHVVKHNSNASGQSHVKEIEDVWYKDAEALSKTEKTKEFLQDSNSENQVENHTANIPVQSHDKVIEDVENEDSEGLNKANSRKEFQKEPVIGNNELSPFDPEREYEKNASQKSDVDFDNHGGKGKFVDNETNWSFVTHTENSTGSFAAKFTVEVDSLSVTIKEFADKKFEMQMPQNRNSQQKSDESENVGLHSKFDINETMRVQSVDVDGKCDTNEMVKVQNICIDGQRDTNETMKVPFVGVDNKCDINEIMKVQNGVDDKCDTNVKAKVQNVCVDSCDTNESMKVQNGVGGECDINETLKVQNVGADGKCDANDVMKVQNDVDNEYDANETMKVQNIGIDGRCDFNDIMKAQNVGGKCDTSKILKVQNVDVDKCDTNQMMEIQNVDGVDKCDTNQMMEIQNVDGVDKCDTNQMMEIQNVDVDKCDTSEILKVQNVGVDKCDTNQLLKVQNVVVNGKCDTNEMPRVQSVGVNDKCDTNEMPRVQSVGVNDKCDTNEMPRVQSVGVNEKCDTNEIMKVQNDSGDGQSDNEIVKVPFADFDVKCDTNEAKKFLNVGADGKCGTNEILEVQNIGVDSKFNTNEEKKVQNAGAGGECDNNEIVKVQNIGIDGKCDTNEVMTVEKTIEMCCTAKAELDSSFEMSDDNKVSQELQLCSLCGAAFMEEKPLLTHLLKNHKKLPFQVCPLPSCSVLVARNKAALHLKQHLVTGRFRCSFCSFSSPLKGSLTKHEKAHYRLKEVLQYSSSSEHMSDLEIGSVSSGEIEDPSYSKEKKAHCKWVSSLRRKGGVLKRSVTSSKANIQQLTHAEEEIAINKGSSRLVGELTDDIPVDHETSKESIFTHSGFSNLESDLKEVHSYTEAFNGVLPTTCCGQLLSRITDLISHYRDHYYSQGRGHLNGIPCIDSNCPVFLKTTNMTLHLKQHVTSAKFHCQLCTYKTNHSVALRAHHLSHDRCRGVKKRRQVVENPMFTFNRRMKFRTCKFTLRKSSKWISSNLRFRNDTVSCKRNKSANENSSSDINSTDFKKKNNRNFHLHKKKLAVQYLRMKSKAVKFSEQNLVLDTIMDRPYLGKVASDGYKHTATPFQLNESNETDLDDYSQRLNDAQCNNEKKVCAKGKRHTRKRRLNDCTQNVSKLTVKSKINKIKCNLSKGLRSKIKNKNEKKLKSVFSGMADIRLRKFTDTEEPNYHITDVEESFACESFGFSADCKNISQFHSHGLSKDFTKCVEYADFSAKARVSDYCIESSELLITQSRETSLFPEQKVSVKGISDSVSYDSDRQTPVDEVLSNSANEYVECSEPPSKAPESNLESGVDKSVYADECIVAVSLQKDDENFKCPLCSESYHNPNTLIDHYTFFHSKHCPYVCKYKGCPALLNKKNSKKHISSHIYKSNFDCPFCTYSHKSLYLLKHHILIHEQVSKMLEKDHQASIQVNGLGGVGMINLKC